MLMMVLILLIWCNRVWSCVGVCEGWFGWNVVMFSVMLNRLRVFSNCNCILVGIGRVVVRNFVMVWLRVLKLLGWVVSVCSMVCKVLLRLLSVVMVSNLIMDFMGILRSVENCVYWVCVIMIGFVFESGLVRLVLFNIVIIGCWVVVMVLWFLGLIILMVM